GNRACRVRSFGCGRSTRATISGVHAGLLSGVGLIAGLFVALVRMTRAQRAQEASDELAERAALVRAVMSGEIDEAEYQEALGSAEAIAWADTHRATLTAMEAFRAEEQAENPAKHFDA